MKMKLFQIVLFFALILIHSVAYGQGFPWDEFKPRTLKEIIALDADDVKRYPDKNRLIIHADPLSSKVRMRYTGESRPIPSTRKEVLKLWTGSLQIDPKYLEGYENEFLFIEDKTDYWLPVQKKVIGYFDKELKKGDDVDLYLIRVGGIKQVKGEWDWLFLVEEFQKL